MTQPAGRILKGDQVNIEGTCQLGVPRGEHKSAQNMNVAAKSPQARIIENNEGHVIIQVVCSCGKQINLRGEYIAPHLSK
jgi:hypothetical protein